jgi:hypothetical protein
MVIAANVTNNPDRRPVVLFLFLADMCFPVLVRRRKKRRYTWIRVRAANHAIARSTDVDAKPFSKSKHSYLYCSTPKMNELARALSDDHSPAEQPLTIATY